MFQWILLLCWAPLLHAQADEIRAMLKNSVEVWNRGDLVVFVSDYEDSPETTYIGREVVRGTKAILERYRKHYPDREAMGTLAFSDVEVRPLTSDLALVTGEFHLKRSAAGGGDASGLYTLLVRKTPSGWKIIHDHSSPL
jgi:ketosteroid isomerase-like protein